MFCLTISGEPRYHKLTLEWDKSKKKKSLQIRSLNQKQLIDNNQFFVVA